MDVHPTFVSSGMAHIAEQKRVDSGMLCLQRYLWQAGGRIIGGDMDMDSYPVRFISLCKASFVHYAVVPWSDLTDPWLTLFGFQAKM